MWIVKLFIEHWRAVLIASLSCALLLTMSAWQAATAQRDAAKMALQNFRLAAEVAATDAKIKSDYAIQKVKDDYAVQTQKIEQTAYQNAKARFSRPVVACGSGIVGVFPRDTLPHSETRSAEPADGKPEESLVVERDFIEACASDALTVSLWQQWAESNDLPILP